MHRTGDIGIFKIAVEQSAAAIARAPHRSDQWRWPLWPITSMRGSFWKSFLRRIAVT